MCTVSKRGMFTGRVLLSSYVHPRTRFAAANPLFARAVRRPERPATLAVDRCLSGCKTRKGGNQWGTNSLRGRQICRMMLATFGRVRAPLAGRRERMIIYVGPDQVMPISSVLGTLVGLILLFWNKLVVMVSRLTGRPLEKSGSGEPASPVAPASRTEEP